MPCEACSSTCKHNFLSARYNVMLAHLASNSNGALHIKKLKVYSVDFIGAGAGVSEPGLNRRPENMIA